jgi:hypothetical protein
MKNLCVFSREQQDKRGVANVAIKDQCYADVNFAIHHLACHPKIHQARDWERRQMVLRPLDFTRLGMIGALILPGLSAYHPPVPTLSSNTNDA